MQQQPETGFTWLQGGKKNCVVGVGSIEVGYAGVPGLDMSDYRPNKYLKGTAGNKNPSCP